jgi:hypothetical protein
MEFEKEFEFKIKVNSYTRNIKTNKITQIDFLIEGKGLKNADGDYLSGITKPFTVDVPDDAPDNTIKHEEISKDLMHYWIHTFAGEEVMEGYIRSVYNTMYPDTVIFYPKFQY